MTTTVTLGVRNSASGYANAPIHRGNGVGDSEFEGARLGRDRSNIIYGDW